MNTLTCDNETLADRCTGRTRLVFLSLLMAGAIVAICPGRGLAQASIVSTAPEVTATRPRRLTSEVRPLDCRRERRVFVRSTSLLVGAAVVEDKLLKEPEFRRLGFVLTRDDSDADLVLELHHDLFTKYVFTVVDAKTGVVLLAGKLSSLGGTVAGKVARRFVKEIAGAVGP